ncbi:hypothetical protein L6452_36822 [Arctium lappa]|uniref:Uncharacterized protein n=1 Tax=Arctium lappa TaxID=4217 RepID=A0ACB8Y183_ARCLA|nr:hypothetical protein L6452_36822 [Arctium lappa]
MKAPSLQYRIRSGHNNPKAKEMKKVDHHMSLSASSDDTTAISNSLENLASLSRVPDTPPQQIPPSIENQNPPTPVNQRPFLSIYLPKGMETTSNKSTPREPSIHQSLMDALDATENLERNDDHQMGEDEVHPQNTNVEDVADVVMAEAIAASDAQVRDRGKSIMEEGQGSRLKDNVMEDQQPSKNIIADSEEDEGEDTQNLEIEDPMEWFSCKEAYEKYPAFAQKIT